MSDLPVNRKNLDIPHVSGPEGQDGSVPETPVRDKFEVLNEKLDKLQECLTEIMKSQVDIVKKLDVAIAKAKAGRF